MNRLRTELVLFGMATLTLTAFPTVVQAPTPTPAPMPAPVPTPGDAPIIVLGLPLNLLISVLGLTGTGMFFGQNVLALAKSGFALAQARVTTTQKRWEADLERDGVETLNLKQEAEFLKQMNDTVRQMNLTIASLQAADAAKSGIITGMQGNSLNQAHLITDMQANSFERDKAHNGEIATLNGRVEAMLRRVELSEANAETWERKYQTEHDRAEDLAAALSDAFLLLERYEPGSSARIAGTHPSIAVVAPPNSLPPL